MFKKEKIESLDIFHCTELVNVIQMSPKSQSWPIFDPCNRRILSNSAKCFCQFSEFFMFIRGWLLKEILSSNNFQPNGKINDLLTAFYVRNLLIFSSTFIFSFFLPVFFCMQKKSAIIELFCDIFRVDRKTKNVSS